MADVEGKNEGHGFAGNLASRFIDSKLTPLAVLASILLGVASVLLLPREEEPQIKVPMVDIMVEMPGSTALEVENRVTKPMEKLLWEIPGVEYIYSTSYSGRSMVIVRFLVGSDIEDSVLKIQTKLETNYDRIPPGVREPLIKPRSIDDVPILALTFHSPEVDSLELRRMAREVEDRVKKINQVAETNLIGGEPRQILVQLDPIRLAGYNLEPSMIVDRLRQANRYEQTGSQTRMNREIPVETGFFFRSQADVENLVVGVFGDSPVFLRDVARIEEGPDKPEQTVFHLGRGEAPEAAVTLSLAKRPGSNAIHVVDRVLEVVDSLKGYVIPGNVEVTVTRDYGETAAEKSNELLLHMGIAIVSVAALILFFLGWRESIIVLLAIPSTLGLTLLVFYLYGYTLNRITLFALIFSIGILVDDAIVVVENIVRHFRMHRDEKLDLPAIAVKAVAGVGNPTVLATWAVIAAILPMAFVGGLMGPYMRPIPIGASAAMLFSLLIAFIVTPWSAVRILLLGRSAESLESHEGGEKEGWMTRLYRAVMGPLLERRFLRWGFLVGITLLLLASMGLVLIGWVQVKMLPFDNKSEFQVILNMPEGTPLEVTTNAAMEMGRELTKDPMVTHVQSYAGTASPFNFNGLVRHYYLRSEPHQGDLQVNLLPKHHRKEQSHDIAVRLRERLVAIAERYDAEVEIAEVPPGPPVIQTLVVEAYGGSEGERIAFADQARRLLESIPGVVDVDWYREDPHDRLLAVPDTTKAAYHGISADEIARNLRIALSGEVSGLLHLETELEDIPIRVRMGSDFRNHEEDLSSIYLRSRSEPGEQISLRELSRLERVPAEQPRYRKNLRSVLYVTANVAGAIESPVYAIQKLYDAVAKHPETGESVPVYHLGLPDSEKELSMKWDGEWHITLEVFRDLGLAFIAVLILIYMLMVGWFRSFIIPLVVMAAIPFSLVGILPAHSAMGAFFTATSMIGFMAGAGIVVRNSIILVDFIQLKLEEGVALREAVVEAGAVRFRPMLLTALAVVVAASVILADPIFQGLAISLMFGEIASLLISRMAVPVLYFMVKKEPGR